MLFFSHYMVLHGAIACRRRQTPPGPLLWRWFQSGDVSDQRCNTGFLFQPLCHFRRRYKPVNYLFSGAELSDTAIRAWLAERRGEGECTERLYEKTPTSLHDHIQQTSQQPAGQAWQSSQERRWFLSWIIFAGLESKVWFLSNLLFCENSPCNSNT